MKNAAASSYSKEEIYARFMQIRRELTAVLTMRTSTRKQQLAYAQESQRVIAKIKSELQTDSICLAADARDLMLMERELDGGYIEAAYNSATYITQRNS